MREVRIISVVIRVRERDVRTVYALGGKGGTSAPLPLFEICTKLIEAIGRQDKEIRFSLCVRVDRKLEDII